MDEAIALQHSQQVSAARRQPPFVFEHAQAVDLDLRCVADLRVALKENGSLG